MDKDIQTDYKDSQRGRTSMLHITLRIEQICKLFQFEILYCIQIQQNNNKIAKQIKTLMIRTTTTTIRQHVRNVIGKYYKT